MDREMVTFLQNSGLESFIEIFIKNKIGINQIGEITADILPLLIVPIGNQLRYKKAVEAFKAKVLTENNAPTTSNTAKCIITVIDAHENILTDYELQHSNAFCDESNVLAELKLKNVSPLTLADEKLENLDNQMNDNDELSTKINTHEKFAEIAEIAQSQSCKKVKLEDIRSSSPSISSISEISTTMVLYVTSGAMTFEGKHKTGLQVPRNSARLINLTPTIAIDHQLRLAYKLSNEEILNNIIN